jgi:hypothetical protein
VALWRESSGYLLFPDENREYLKRRDVGTKAK